MNSNDFVNIPILFQVPSDEYDEFMEQIKVIDKLHPYSKANLGMIKGKGLYASRTRVVVSRQRTIEKILTHFQKYEKEIKIGKLYKRVNRGMVSYKTFQRIIAQMSFNDQIETRKSKGATGNTTFIKLKPFHKKRKKDES